MLHVYAIASIEVAEAVALHKLHYVLLTFWRILFHLISRTCAKDTVYPLASLLPASLGSGSALIIERKFDVIVFKGQIHLKQEVYDLRESYVGDCLIDNLPNLTRFHTHIETNVHIRFKLSHSIASDGAGEYTHDSCFLKDRSFS